MVTLFICNESAQSQNGGAQKTSSFYPHRYYMQVESSDKLYDGYNTV